MFVTKFFKVNGPVGSERGRSAIAGHRRNGFPVAR
jgi:hypothetical protein